MERIGKKIRQMLTTLLTVSMLAGSIPVNAYGLADLAPMIENEVIADAYSEGTAVEDIVETEEVLEEGVNAVTEVSDAEIFASEESLTNTVSDNTGDTDVQEETKEMVDIKFTVSENSYASYVKVIRVYDDKPETEVENNQTSVTVGEPLKFRLELSEGYKVTSVTMGNGLLLETEGIYTVYPAAAATIEIKVAELETYNVTFDYDEELVKELIVKRDGKDVVLENDVALGMWENSKVSFTLTLKNMMKIVKVTANKKEIESTGGNTFVLPPLEEDVEVKIEISLDDSKCNTLDIGVVGHGKSVSIKNNGDLYGNGERLLSKNAKEEITVVPNGNYEVDKIILNNTVTLYDKSTDKEDKFASGTAVFDIDFSKNKNQSIFIYTTPKKSNEKKKLIFANKAEHITYEVTMHAINEPDRIIVEKEEGKNNTYTINAEERIVEFKVIAQNGYEPVVSIPTGVDYDVTVKGNTYTYSVAVTTLGSVTAPTEISIDEIAQIRTISVIYSEDKLEEMTALVDGKPVHGESTYDGTKKLTTQKFRFAHGTKVVLRLVTKPGFTVGTVKETQGKEILSETKLQKTECSYTIKADKDKNVELQLDNSYVTRVYDVQEENVFELEAEENTYPVETGKKYKVHLYNGSQLQTVTKAVLNSEGNTYKENVKIVDSQNVYIEIPELENGKKLTLELTCKEGKSNVILVMEMRVFPGTKITKITGIAKGKVSQTTDTVKAYKFTSNIKDAESRLGIEIITAKAEEDILSEAHRKELNEKANEEFEAKIVEDELVITVKTTQSGSQAYIKLYDVLKSTETKKQYVKNGTILVTSKAPAFVKTKPTVSQKSATNLNLILNLGIKNYVEPKNGELWYRIEGTPKNTDKLDAGIKEKVSSFVQYVRCTGKKQTDSIRVVGISENSLQEGDVRQKAEFEIKVSLVQTKDKNIPKEKVASDENVAFISKISDKKVMSTKVPAYETKLEVKSIQSMIYSGQKDVIAAVPVFSKNTTYQKINCVSKKEGVHASVDVKNNILVSVDKGVKPGKYVIEVIAQAAKDTVPAKKNFTIQVVQSVNEITLDTPKELYKAYQKKASFQVGITYNEKTKIQPKTKKVKWSLEDAQGNEIDKKHPYYEMFSIKNGVVTIRKDFIVSDNSEENRFRVKAVAKDFERKEAEVAGYSDWIQITNKKVTLGELVLVKETWEGSGIYDVTARTGSKTFTDEVHKSKLVILKKGTPERDQYTEEDFMQGLEDRLVYSSSHKNIKIRKDQTVSVNDIADDIEISAKMADGSGVMTRLKDVYITYAPVRDLGVVIRKADSQMSVIESYNSSAAGFYGAKDEAFTIKIQEKKDGISQDVFGADHELKVQGAEIVKSRKMKGEYEIVGTDDVIVIEIVNHTSNLTKTFTLKNLSLANQMVQDNKPLVLTVKGNLKTGYYTKEQTITYTLPKESRKKYTHAWVTIDRLDYLNKKNTAIYDDLLKASDNIGEIQQLGRDGKVVITFKPAKGEEKYYIPEKDFTYKLNIYFGTMTEEYEFKAEVQPNAVTWETKAAGLESAKIKTTFAIGAKEEAMAEIVLGNKKVKISHMGQLMNKNVKGIQNKFTDYFELNRIEEKGKETAYFIQLKKGVDVTEIAAKDLKGYISQYTYTDGDRSKTVKNIAVKVELKDVTKKYSLSKAIVLTEDEISTDVKLFAGKKKVNVGYAYAPTDQNFSVSVNDDGTIHLQSKEHVPVKAKQKCTVYVLPEYSYYNFIIDEIWKAELSEEQLMKVMDRCGIKLTANISVKDKEKATGKIKFADTDLKPQFTEKNYVPDETNTEVLAGDYVLKIPYTKVVDWEVEDIENQDTSNIVKVAKTPGEDSVTLTLNKKALRNAYAKDEKIYGKTITVKAIAKFGEGTKEEIFTFKVKLPKQTVQLKKAIEKLNKIAWADLSVQYEGLTKEQLIDVNSTLVEEKVRGVLSTDGDITFTVSGNNEGQITKVPTKKEEGQIVYKVILTDTGVKPQEQKKFIVVIPLDKLLTKPAELTESLQGAIQYWENKKITNATTLSSILSSIRGKVKMNEYKHLRLYAKDVKTVTATMERAGSIRGVFCIINVADKNVEPLEIAFSFEIPKLMKLEEAAAAVKETLEKITLYNVDLGENRQKKTEELLEEAEEVLEEQGYSVYLKQGTVLQGTVAEGDSVGKATLKLEIVYVTTERISKDVTCEFKVLEKEK